MLVCHAALHERDDGSVEDVRQLVMFSRGKHFLVGLDDEQSLHAPEGCWRVKIRGLYGQSGETQ
jgi:hypothetical protein